MWSSLLGSMIENEDKLAGDEDDRTSGQQGEPSRTQPQPTPPVGTTTVAGEGTTEEGDESSFNLPPLAAIYPDDIQKSD
ncbi:hypothetical protein WN944_003073 [Citrus x changshan-huyou]|uniref:Uncharacterized protein n=1 Tax=Citrus x changshan-huyou TaxID=2935761 RepID=A0AAP0LYI1_9ROSI